MSDDKSKRAPADRSKISLSDDLRSALLDERPRRDKQELTAAVQAVGNSVRARQAVPEETVSLGPAGLAQGPLAG